ncbi:MAG: ATP-binding protein [Nitrospirae bacterium]|nr:ATP-binding protein [Nitrospirota bacterium]NTW65476.1 ATP-binding protein [Nitrospirota bacterium]
MEPLIVQKTITLPLPSDDDRRAHDQRLRDALGLGPLHIPLSLLRSTAAIINAKRELSCIIGRAGDQYRLIDIDRRRSYSVALDLGTTNLVAVLYDNIGQKDIVTRSLENPQVEYGSDILTRMHHAMTGNGEDIYRVLRNGINTLIASLCREAGVNGRDLHGLAAAGNTAMTHFLLGLDISTIPVAPWVPVVRTPGFFSAAELGLDINPEALAYVFPNAGSYVGGDITAGIIATGMHASDRPSILVDVGTNAEVVIGNREWMIVGAGAAGPALEEGISAIGKRAKKGIVYDIEISGDCVSCKTFDQGRPEGICGSGMVSLLYELYTAGIIDQTGALTGKRHIIEINGEKAFSINCDCEDALFITQGEIQNFMRSKAAMFTLLLVLTRSVGVAFRDIESVFVSGALGTGIDVKKAAGIGMVPGWQAGIVKPMGNTSLEGCRMLLRDAGIACTADRLVDKITYKHMHDDPEFMKEFMGSVFIPHTNPELLRV